jgi:hypothetical protein
MPKPKLKVKYREATHIEFKLPTKTQILTGALCVLRLNNKSGEGMDLPLNEDVAQFLLEKSVELARAINTQQKEAEFATRPYFDLDETDEDGDDEEDNTPSPPIPITPTVFKPRQTKANYLDYFS